MDFRPLMPPLTPQERIEERRLWRYWLHWFISHHPRFNLARICALVTEYLAWYSIQALAQHLELLTSGGDKRPRTFTGKCFRAIDPPQKILLIDKIISLSEKVPSCDKKEGSC